MKTWTPYIAVWSLLAVIVLVLAAYRKMLSAREDDSLHVAEGTKAMVSDQLENAHKIEAVEKWGKMLTAVAVLTGLLMLGIYIYNVFQSGSTTAVVQ